MYSHTPWTQVPSTAELPQHNVWPSVNPDAAQFGFSNEQSKFEASLSLCAMQEAAKTSTTMKRIEMNCIKAEVLKFGRFYRIRDEETV